MGQRREVMNDEIDFVPDSLDLFGSVRRDDKSRGLVCCLVQPKDNERGISRPCADYPVRRGASRVGRSRSGAPRMCFFHVA